MKKLITLVLCLIASNAFAAFPSVPTVANQAKVEIMSGKIKSSDTFKMVLKVQANAGADGASSGSYTTTGELANGNGYTQGGITLTGCVVTLSSSNANLTCASPVAWTLTSGSSMTADAAEIYDASCTANGCTNANQVVGLFPFTSTTASGNGSTFSVTIPANLFSLQ